MCFFPSTFCSKKHQKVLDWWRPQLHCSHRCIVSVCRPRPATQGSSYTGSFAKKR
ncbi:hypothetical protein BDD12DRAFT_848433 [Trichophaea hybrida]|nr:hypothetical protein BDD12DRAFT_848433 [Trichophaea hybrida]